MKVIVCDRRKNFLDDINLALIIDQRNVEIADSTDNAEDVFNLINTHYPDAVLVADNIFNERENWNFNLCKTVGYITSKNAVDVFADVDIPCLGYIRTSEHLLNMLECPLPVVDKGNTSGSEGVVASSKPTTKRELPVYDETDESIGYSSKQNSTDNSDKKKTEVITVYSANGGFSTSVTEPPAHKATQPAVVDVFEEPSVKEVLSKKQSERKQTEAEAIYSMNNDKKKTEVITVYSAKGGVGKTTISSELATYMSRISIGRGFLRVCLVDYNIDFGNVMETLDFDPRGVNMTYWASEIRDRIENGESLDEINYSKDAIEKKLQKHEDTGLYALLAPATHQDSMMIDGPELDVMLRNLIQFGSFDYIICDTGNNTRDSSFYALQAADTVLMIATQDVSTASCNSGFLNAMRKYDFDEKKVKLIINCLMPYKYTEVSAADLEKMFQFECVAHIKRSPEVTRANNLSEPLVLSDQDHDFTKAIKKIVAHIMHQDTEPVSKKKGFLSKLFGRS